jgi:hypothetical protein
MIADPEFDADLYAAQYEQYGRALTGNFPLNIPEEAARIRREKQAHIEKTRQQQLAEEMGLLQTEQEAALGRLTRQFRTAAETATAQQLGGVLRGVGQTAARRGIVGSGVAAGIEGQARTALAGQALQAQLDFRTQLEGLFQQQRHQFRMGRYDFFEAMDLLNRQGQIQYGLAELQLNARQDDALQQSLFGLGQSAGSVGMTLLQWEYGGGPFGGYGPGSVGREAPSPIG